MNEEILKDLGNKLDKNTQVNYALLMSNIILNSKSIKDEAHREILLLLLQDRDRNYIRINDNEEVFANIKRYLELLRPLNIDTKELVRIGGKSDGGYVIYKDKNLNLALGGGVLHNVNLKAISLGVSESSPWDLEMANLGYQVIEYDASIEKCPYEHKNIKFHKKFVGVETKGDFISLEAVIEQNGLDEKMENILQIDIENAEWDILERIDMKLIERYFTQVIFEFHGCNPEELDEFAKRLKVIEKINEFYQCYHCHFHNHGKIFYSKGLFFCTTIEASFLRKDSLPKDSKGLREKGNLENLDYAGFLSNPDIPVIFL